jgi:hypothetical protein
LYYLFLCFYRAKESQVIQEIYSKTQVDELYTLIISYFFLVLQNPETFDISNPIIEQKLQEDTNVKRDLLTELINQYQGIQNEKPTNLKMTSMQHHFWILFRDYRICYDSDFMKRLIDYCQSNDEMENLEKAFIMLFQTIHFYNQNNSVRCEFY